MYAVLRKALWAGVVFVAFALGAARAVRAHDALPFSDAELQQALLARLLPASSEPGPPAARVEPAGPGVVTVRVGSRTRAVAVGDRTGSAAARVVALVIAELLTAGGPEEAPAVVTPARQPVETSAGATEAAGELQLVLPEARRRWRLVVTGGATRGTGADEWAAGTLNADLVIAPRAGRLKLAPSLGLTMMPTRNPGELNEVSFRGLTARLLGGFGRGPVDVLAGPIASAYAIGGATAHSGFLFGGEILARVAAPLSRRVRLAVDARVDGWANRVRVHWADGGSYATPRVGFGIGVGLAWDWPS